MATDTPDNENPVSKSSGRKSPNSKSPGNESSVSKNSVKENPVSKSSSNESPVSKSPGNESPARKFKSMPMLEADYHASQKFYNEGVDDAAVVRSTRIVWIFFLMLAVFITWSYFAELDEVTSGSGKVIPSSRAQIIQSLEGGIIADLKVAAGDIVEAGQILAQLDLIKTQSNVEEGAARYRAALARMARLNAEVDETELIFPEELKAHPELIAEEMQLYRTRQRSLKDALSGINKSLRLVTNELDITKSLVQSGAASSVEVLRLRRQRSELELKAMERRSEYMVRAREELATASEEVVALSSVVRGRSDALTRLTLRSPVRGIVKDIEVTTVGGVVPPGGRLMEIVPLDDKLLIETRISPRDIAFIHPNQEAKVKFTAYDYSIYGGLDGKVVTISPDTIQDEVNPEIFYYRVFIRTETDALVNEAGTSLPITPGMITTADIKTGAKTVMNYLIKPLNRAKEALRER